MMKKSISIICVIIAVISLLAVPVSAEENSTYSSIFFCSYDSAIYVEGRTLEIWFDVVGNGGMDEIGVSCITLERSSNGSSWSTVKTFYPEDYPQMICYDTGIAYDYVTYTGSSGYYYRAYVTYYAKNSRGRGNAYQYSETVYMPAP